jgi:hypothetical protein
LLELLLVLAPKNNAAVTWIFACATVVSVFVAYGIGANDVANAFGTSVGAKALTSECLEAPAAPALPTASRRVPTSAPC